MPGINRFKITHNAKTQTTMKTIVTVITILLLSTTQLLAQESTENDHPLDGFEEYLRTDDMILFFQEDVYNEETGETTRELFSQIFYSDKKPTPSGENLAIENKFIFQDHDTPADRRVHQYNTAGFEPDFDFNAFHRSPVDVVTGDFNGDDFETFVGGYAGDGVIYFVVNELTPVKQGGDNRDNFDIEITDYNIVTAAEDYTGGLFRMYTEDLTRDGKSEIILAYRNETNYLIDVFSITDQLGIEKLASHDAGAFPNGYSSFDVTAGKLTLNNSREIVFSYAAENSDGGTVVIETTVINAVPSGGSLSLNMRETKEVYTGNVRFEEGINIANVTGDFTGNVIDEIAVGFNIWQSAGSGQDNVDNLFVRILDLADESLVVWPGFGTQVSIVNEMAAFSMATGDLKGTGQDNIIVASGGQALILEAPERPEITTDITDNGENGGSTPDRNVSILINQQLGLSVSQGTAYYSSRYISVSDLNQNRESIEAGEGRYTKEFIGISSGNPENLQEGSSYSFYLKAFGVESQNQANLNNLITETFESVEVTNDFSPRARSFALGGGDFTNSRIRYENPRRFQLTQINRPWIVLKAPPTHFDMFGEEVLDVNGCFISSNCGFEVTFTAVESGERNVSTSVESDWTVEASAGGGFGGIMSFGMSAKYGERFGHSTFSAETQTFSQSRTARDTDQIYASKTAYDLWEYDVYDRDNRLGTVLVVIPISTTNAWLSSGYESADQYRPFAEESNLLSYPRLLQDSTPEIGSPIKGFVQSDPGFNIDGSSSSTWTLEFGDFMEETNFSESSVSISGSVGIDALGVGVSGSYTTTELNTNRMAVGEELKIELDLGSLNSQFPTSSYSIKPYAYWHEDGYLVIDYGVELDQQGVGGPETFWNQRYGHKPDPALKLPWRHLREKSELRAGGGPVDFDEDLTEQSKSISYLPVRPNPGDTVTVEVDVHNFSLVELVDHVDVHLFLGHPNMGEPIEFLDGSDQLQTDAIIPIRGRQTVSGQFIMPETTPERRLYAMLDRDELIDEIHPDNNLGYVRLNTTAEVVTSIGDEISFNMPQNFKLHNNYPNPFNPSTNINFDLPQNQDVRLEVFDLLGRRVALIVNETLTAGYHSVTFDASALTSGVYFYRIQAGSFLKTQKMMLVK
jgi:hypothetical protein